MPRNLFPSDSVKLSIHMLDFAELLNAVAAVVDDEALYMRDAKGNLATLSNVWQKILASQPMQDGYASGINKISG